MGVPGGIGGKETSCPCRRHETQLWSLGQEDPLEEGMATHFQGYCQENPMDRGAWRAKSIGSQRVRHDWSDSMRAHKADYSIADMSVKPGSSDLRSVSIIILQVKIQCVCWGEGSWLQKKIENLGKNV